MRNFHVGVLMHHPSSLDRKPDLLARLMAIRKDLPRMRCVIVHPCDPGTVEGAHQASAALLALVSTWRTDTAAVLA